MVKAQINSNNRVWLSDLKVGQMAYASDTSLTGRGAIRVFACLWIPISDGKNANQQQIVELTDLSNQYLDKLGTIVVTLISAGESVTLTV
jgi:hypothetical protein